MAFNFSTYEVELSKKLVSTTDPTEILLISKMVSLLKQRIVNVVGTFSLLPPLNTTTTGDLYYVVTDNLLYYSNSNTNGKVWTPIAATATSSIFGSGANSFCLFGDFVSSTSVPTQVITPFSDWKTVCQSGAFNVGLRTNGTIWTWGCNAQGQLGDNTTVSRSSPVSVVGGFTDWCQVSAGGAHTAAVRTNGTIWAWGCNPFGQLGDNTTVSKLSPVSVVGGFSDWCQVSAGGAHTAAVRTNGTLWAWGCNAQGQLGDNTIVSKLSPVSVVGGFTDWCQVSAGNQHTAAIRASCTLWTWGSNTCGQLGNGCTVSRSSPAQVVGANTCWCFVTASVFNTFALKTNGTLWGWGKNYAGELGDNTAFNKSSPVSVVGGFTDWCQVSSTNLNTAAVRTNGTLWTWGDNYNGQLGHSGISVSPVAVCCGYTDWCQVSFTNSRFLAIRNTTITP